MNRFRFVAMSWVGLGFGLAMALPVAGQHQPVLEKLNDHDTIRGSEAIKSYRVLFDAYLTLDPPPFEVGDDFNLYTIYPGMSGWSQVSGWAESNAGMAEAILECKDRNMIGLPYGVDEVDAAYRQAGIVVQIAVLEEPVGGRQRFRHELSVLQARGRPRDRIFESEHGQAPVLSSIATRHLRW